MNWFLTWTGGTCIFKQVSSPKKGHSNQPGVRKHCQLSFSTDADTKECRQIKCDFMCVDLAVIILNEKIIIFI